MITLSVDSTSVTLPEELYWSDELSWSPVGQTVEISVEGAPMVDVAAQTAGRYITLEPNGEDAWITREDLEQLTAWAAVPGLEMELTIRSVERTVIWRHQDKPAIDCRPLIHFTDTQPGDIYIAGLKLMEI